MSTRTFWATLRKYGKNKFRASKKNSFIRNRIESLQPTTRVRWYYCPITYCVYKRKALKFDTTHAETVSYYINLTHKEAQDIIEASDRPYVYLNRRQRRIRRKMFDILHLNKSAL